MVLFKKYKILKLNDKNFRYFGQTLFYFLSKLRAKSDFAANYTADSAANYTAVFSADFTVDYAALRLNNRASAD